MAAKVEVCDVVVVGCGMPMRGMGWYHSKNILDGFVPNARLTEVVEPWFLGNEASSEDKASFKVFVDANPNVKFLKSVDDMEACSPGQKKLALIAGRADSNPILLQQVIDKGVSGVYLEKPGASSVEKLIEMSKYAKNKNIPVYMGYNKNVTKYVVDAIEADKKAEEASSISFYHNNSYTKETLPECFERNCEGILKNMAIHELGLLVRYFGVRADNVATLEADMEYSSFQIINGYDDFDKIGFTLTTKDTNKKLSIYADRCGGNYAEAIVKNLKNDSILFKTMTPDDELLSIVAKKQLELPDCMPYFLLQHDDYITLKSLTCASILSQGGDGGSSTMVAPPGVASIDDAIETLKLAEYLEPQLKTMLKDNLEKLAKKQKV